MMRSFLGPSASTVLRCARRSFSLSSPVTSVTEFVRQLRDPLTPHQDVLQSPLAQQVDAATVSDALWKSIYDKHYERVLAIHEDLHLTQQPKHLTSVSLHLAAMAASGSLGYTDRLLEILTTMQRQRQNKQQRLIATERLLSVLINSLCAAEEVPTAERLLLQWVDRSVKQRARAAVHSSLPSLDAGNDGDAPPPPPAAPLSVLRGLLKEWSVPPAGGGDSAEGAAAETLGNRDLAATLREKELIAVDSLDWSQLSAPVPLFVWATLLRAYAAQQQWRRCVLLLDVVEKEIALSSSQQIGFSAAARPTSSQASGLPLLPHDVLISRRHVLESLSAPALRSVLYHHTLYSVCIAQRDVDLALHILQRMQDANVPLDAFFVSMSLLKCFHTATPTLSPALAEKDLELKRVALLSLAPTFQLHVLHLLAHNARTEDGYHTAKSLVKELMHLMCKLNLVVEGEVFLRTLARHPSAEKFLTLPQLVHPLIHAYSKMSNQWGKTVELFAHIAHRHHEQPHTYHCVCEALHKAREFDRLASFVDQYGSIEDTSSAASAANQERQQRLRDELAAEDKLGRQMDEDLLNFFNKYSSSAATVHR